MDLLVRRGPLARAYYRFMRFLSQLAGLVLFDIRGFGAYRVPPCGAVVVAPNHQSYLDPWLTGMCVRRPLFYLARDTLFRFPVLRSLLSNVNAIPIPRGRAASRSGIELGRAALRAGKGLVLFPEGTRSRSGQMGQLKRGVELVARPSRATVVPAYVLGSFDLWPPQQLLPKCGKVRIFFGRPMPASTWDAGSGPKSGESSGRESPPAPPKGAMSESGADLVECLEAAYRSLAARARSVRRTGAAGWRLHVSRTTGNSFPGPHRGVISRREPPEGSGLRRAER